MDTRSFLEEISDYSLDDLKLIFETQKDLYSSEEMELIRCRIQKLEEREAKQKQAFIMKNLPKEILCPKCDGINSFKNDHCCYCDYVFDKKKYYSIEYYLNDNAEENIDENGSNSSYTFQFVVSFLIPLVGFILGAILLGKDNENEKSNGKTCIILGIISILIAAVLRIFYVLS